MDVPPSLAGPVAYWVEGRNNQFLNLAAILDPTPACPGSRHGPRAFPRFVSTSSAWLGLLGGLLGHGLLGGLLGSLLGHGLCSGLLGHGVALRSGAADGLLV